MDVQYPVFLGEEIVGAAFAQKDGLYLNIRYQCKISEKSICRLMAGNLNLGVLMPKDGYYCLSTRVPLKKLIGIEEFHICPDRIPLTKQFVPIYPEEPFMYLSRIKTGYYKTEKGIPGIELERS